MEMSIQVILAFITGIIFLCALLAIGCYMAFRNNQNPIPSEAMFIFRVILALAGAGFAVVLTGFLAVTGKTAFLSIRAGGSLAVFIAIYLSNPPSLIEKQLPKPRKTRVVNVPKNRIDEDEVN
jgi:hypothetical protein